ncbi:MAG: DNA-3-methyladenine glycosylase [Bacillota bacterium]
MIILPQDFYFGDTTTVAKDLLGKLLHIKITGKEKIARIVEVEAYLGVDDPACHTFGGRNTPRVKSMYLQGGHAYVYMIYGMYNCLNFVTRTKEHPEAVLIRAVEPIPSVENPRKKDLTTNGPGKLCKYYDITRNQDGVALWRKNSPLYVSDDQYKVTRSQIVSRPRVGVDYAGEAAQWPLRFYIKDNPYISKK